MVLRAPLYVLDFLGVPRTVASAAGRLAMPGLLPNAIALFEREGALELAVRVA